MNQHRNAAKEYLEQQVMNASSTELVVLAYDGAIRFLFKARQAIDEGNIEARYQNNKKAADIISYLMETLDMERGADISRNLQRIYFYMLRRLLDVDMKNSTEAVDDVVTKLKSLRASWEKLSRGQAGEQPKTSDGDAAADKSGPVSATA